MEEKPSGVSIPVLTQLEDISNYGGYCMYLQRPERKNTVLYEDLTVVYEERAVKHCTCPERR